MLTSSDCAALPFAERERIRETAHERYLAGGEPCADPFATEASLRVRHPFPTAAWVVFTLARQDEAGHRVHLVAVYDQHGQRLWHTDEEHHDGASWDFWEVADLLDVAHHGNLHLFSADPDAEHHYQHHIHR